MDFNDLRKRDLKQKIRKLKNKKERWKIWKALMWLEFEGTTKFLDQIDGLKYLEAGKSGIDCVEYAIGKTKLENIIQGIINHDGNPKPGELIIYGNGFTEGKSLKNPLHMGVWQKNGKVVSKWGNKGPLIEHEWDKIVPEFGRYSFFSEYNGKIYLL